MGRLILFVLGFSCAVLLIQKFLLYRRIARLADRVDGFHSGTAQMLDVALEEDALARLQNGIADTQQALERQRQLNTEECRRTSQLTADISHQLKMPLTTLRGGLSGADPADGKPDPVPASPGTALRGWICVSLRDRRRGGHHPGAVAEPAGHLA